MFIHAYRKFAATVHCTDTIPVIQSARSPPLFRNLPPALDRDRVIIGTAEQQRVGGCNNIYDVLVPGSVSDTDEKLFGSCFPVEPELTRWVLVGVVNKF